MSSKNTSDDQAVARLFAAEEKHMRGLLMRLVPVSEVDDLLQESLMKSLKAWPSFRGDSDPATWLHQITRNTALDHLRSRRHRESKQTEPLEDLEAAELTRTESTVLEVPSEAGRRLETKEMSSCIREYVLRLPDEQRLIIELKEFQGLTNAQISAQLGISLDSAKIRLHRARKALRELLEKGCDFYQNDVGSLSCDRRKTASVSLGQQISSKEVKPAVSARRGRQAKAQSNTNTNMSSQNTCGCASTSECASPSTQSLFTPIAAEFVSLGAAIGANCEPCLRYHAQEAQKLGISLEDIARAVAQAEKVKSTPARNILKLAERLTTSGGLKQQEDNSPCSCAGR